MQYHHHPRTQKFASTVLAGFFLMITSSPPRILAQGHHQSRDYLYKSKQEENDPPFGPEIVSDTQKPASSTPITANYRIVGGQNAEPNRFWFYSMILQSEGDIKSYAGCGASLITNCHVLTAAHCVDTEERLNRMDGVYVGAIEPYNYNKGYDYHFSSVSSTNRDRSITLHPEYDSATNENDLAVIRMRECLDPVDFPPVPLATQEYENKLMSRTNRNDNNTDTMLTVVGFGRLEEEDTTRVTTLQMANIPIIHHEACQNMYGSRTVTTDTICAGYETGKIDSCQGDSGGPLLHEHTDGIGNSNTVQVGVTSWGVGCARENRPGVYSSVAKHREWIKETVCTSTAIFGADNLCDNFDLTPIGSPRVPPSLAPTLAPVPLRTSPPIELPTPSPTQRPTPTPTLLLTLPPTTLSPVRRRSNGCGTSHTNSFTYRDKGTGTMKKIECKKLADNKKGDLCELSGASYACRDACDPSCQ